MASELEIEMHEPSASRCDCCGGLHVRLTRFVYRDRDAFAVYYAAYSNGHPDHELALLVSLGEWGEDSSPAQRSAFYCRVRPSEDSYEVMLGDVSESLWVDAEIIGEKLSREQALRHPSKATVFDVIEAAFLRDYSLRGFMERAQCGDTSVPLERSCQAPDDIFALGEVKKDRAKVGRNFASLDGERFFVRCLLPVPVEDYGVWCMGLWIEISKSDYDQAWSAWDDPVQYQALRFSGVVANDIHTDLGLSLALGSKVNLHVPNAETPLMIEVRATGEQADLLSKTWSKAEFEQYAVARGFL